MGATQLGDQDTLEGCYKSLFPGKWSLRHDYVYSPHLSHPVLPLSGCGFPPVASAPHLTTLFASPVCDQVPRTHIPSLARLFPLRTKQDDEGPRHTSHGAVRCRGSPEERGLVRRRGSACRVPRQGDRQGGGRIGTLGQITGLVGRWPVEQQDCDGQSSGWHPQTAGTGAFSKTESGLPFDKRRNPLSH